MNRVAVPARPATQAGEIDSWDSIHGLLKSLKYRLDYGATYSRSYRSKILIPKPVPSIQVGYILPVPGAAYNKLHP